MRHRRWVVVLAFFLLVVLPLAFLGLRIASRHPVVKRAVLSRIIPSVPAELSIDELEIGLGSLEFGDVTLEVAEGGFIVVPSATVNISLRRLIISGMALEKALSSVIVTDPRIVISYGLEKGEEVEAEPFDVSSLDRYLPEYLGVSNASVVFRDVRTGRSLTVHSIDLLLERTEGEPAVGEALGSVLGGENNLSARFTWHGDSRTLSVEGDLTETGLGEGLPVPPAVPVEVSSGVLSGTFRASVSPDTVRGLDLAFALRDAHVTVTSVEEQLSSVGTEGRFSEGELNLREVSGVWRSAEWSAGGTILTGTGELVGLTVEAREVPLAPALTLMGLGEHEAAGRFDATAELSGSFDRPVVDVVARCGELSLRDAEIDDVVVDARFEPGTVEVEALKASLLGGRLSASGTATREPPDLRAARERAAETPAVDAPPDERWSFDLSGEAVDLDLTEVLAVLGAEADAAGELSLTDISARGTLPDPDFESLVRWREASLGPVVLGTGAGGILMKEGSLSFTLSSVDRTYDLSGQVTGLPDGPVVDASLSLESARLESLLASGPGPLPPLAVTGELRAYGPADSVELGGSLLVLGEELSGGLLISGTLEAGQQSAVLTASVESPDARYRGVDLPLSADLHVASDTLVVRDLVVGDFARGSLGVGLGAGRGLSAGIVVSEAPLADVLAVALGFEPRDMEGLVFAAVSARGTRDDPVAGARVAIGNARVGAVDGLDLAADMELSGKEFTLEELALRHARNTILTGRGAGRLGGPLSMALTGRGIPGPLLGGSAETRFDAAFGIGGTTDSPTLDGSVESRGGGVFLGVPFDSYSARISGGDGSLRIAPLVLELEGEYVATADADIPYSAVAGEEGAEATLSVDVTGNPVALLGELSGMGESGSGSGTLRAVVVGNTESFTVAGARLEARADRFRPVALFPRLDDLELSVDVMDGQVVSGAASARSGGKRIEVRSVRGAVADGRELEPLVVGAVDLGTLAVSTGEDGVIANVPGLMLPDEVGRIELTGKDDAPAFLVGGPAEAPYLWGEMVFSDMSFTYPLIEGEGEGLGSALSDAEWSVRMTAGRNLWYWRPDVNLNVERGRSLDFVGSPSRHTLCVSGQIASSRGTLTYLHTEFDVQEVSVDFPSFCEPPRFQVEAETRVADGTVITLSMNTTEDVPVLRPGGVTLDESEIVLASDSPEDSTPEEIMAKLQYGVSYDLLEAEEQAALERRRAVELLGTQIGLRVTRPLLSPIESRIRRGLNLDLVRIDIDFVEHFLAQIDEWSAREGTSQYSPFIADTRMTLGKYISGDWLLSYLGVLEPFEEEIGDQTLGLRSEVGIEYEVSRNTSLSLRVVYDPSIAGWDRRVSIENRYDF